MIFAMFNMFLISSFLSWYISFDISMNCAGLFLLYVESYAKVYLLLSFTGSF